MDETAKQASRVVESTAKAVANWTVGRHAQLDQGLEQRYGANWREEWVGHIAAQMQFLAQAVAVRRPEVFAESVRLTWAAFRARGVPDTDLATSLRCLRDVIQTELPPAAATTASSYVGQALEQVEAAPPVVDEPVIGEGPHQQLALRYLEAVLDGRREDAERVILGAVDAALSIRDAYEHVLQPVQVELGRMWLTGEISVGDEHFASAITQSIMSGLRNRSPERQRKDKVVVAAAAAGELHEIGVRMVADFFDMDGWDVVYLGANTPSADILEAIRRHRADLLAVSVSTLLHLCTIGEVIGQVRQDGACAQTKILVGGPPFRAVTNLWSELGADGSAASATEAVSIGNALVGCDGRVQGDHSRKPDGPFR
jgi:methanogenic corrinoid protein MtbC1